MTPSTTSTCWHLARGRGARWGVVVLWALGAILSYSALRDLAAMLGFQHLLAGLFPLVVDVAVWVGCMNALEARERGRRVIERYAWGLVTGYSLATVAGNALVASAEAVDPRLVQALGDSWAHAVSGVAHAAPAVTMILFAHLAGLLMGGPQRANGAPEVHRAELEPVIQTGQPSRHPLMAPWPAYDAPAAGPDTAAITAADDRAHVNGLTAAEARQAVVRLVRRSRSRGPEVTARDVQRVTGRSPRQARRLLAAALAEVTTASPAPVLVAEERRSPG